MLRELVERAVRVKADVVAGDLTETGGGAGHPGREVLNYGHTMGHAVELASGYALRHGEAVAIGCVYVAELARAAGVLDDAVADRHRTALPGWGSRPGGPARRTTTSGRGWRSTRSRAAPSCGSWCSRPGRAPDPGRPARGRISGRRTT